MAKKNYHTATDAPTRRRRKKHWKLQSLLHYTQTQQTKMTNFSESMWNLDLLPVKTLYLYYRLANWWLTKRSFHWYSYMILKLHGLARSRGNLKTLYLHYHSAHDHQTLQDGNLPWWAPRHIVIWHLDYEVLQDYVAN